MRIKIVGRHTKPLIQMATERGLEVDQEHFDVILCHGGDGTLLGAERDYPGVPKLALRPDSECRKCPRHRTENMLDALARDTLIRTRLIKLLVEIQGDGSALGMNDIILHNADPLSAVRYRVWINDELYSEEIVGDGLVAATPFGSSAYYRSITHSVIRSGIGLAFNNSTEPIDHIVLSDEEVVHVLITRGPAVLGADNDPHRRRLSEGSKIVIRRADCHAEMLAADTLLCNNCSRLDGRKWNRHGGLLSL